MRRQQSKSVVFLTELLLALMIFALCSSICASLFAWSYRLSGYSVALSQAVVAAQSAAEAFKRTTSPEGLASTLEGTVEGGDCAVGYDEDWKATRLADAAYVMRVRFAQDDILRRGLISVRDADGEEIFSLEASALLTEGMP